MDDSEEVLEDLEATLLPTVTEEEVDPDSTGDHDQPSERIDSPNEQSLRPSWQSLRPLWPSLRPLCCAVADAVCFWGTLFYLGSTPVGRMPWDQGMLRYLNALLCALLMFLVCGGVGVGLSGMVFGLLKLLDWFLGC